MTRARVAAASGCGLIALTVGITAAGPWWLQRFRSATSPIDRSMRWLTNLDWEGEPAVIDLIAQQCADGIIVRPGVGDGDWFFIDGDGSVDLLPGWCDGPRWVEARLAEVTSRGALIGPS